MECWTHASYGVFIGYTYTHTHTHTQKSRKVVWFQARATKRDMSGVANELLLVVSKHTIIVHHVRLKSCKWKRWWGRTGEGTEGVQRWGCSPEPAIPPRPPPLSTLIPLSGVFDQQLTTGLCDSYHWHAEVWPDLLRAGGESCRLFSMWLFLLMKTNVFFPFFSDLQCFGFRLHHSQWLSRIICCSLLTLWGNLFNVFV